MNEVEPFVERKDLPEKRRERAYRRLKKNHKNGHHNDELIHEIWLQGLEVVSCPLCEESD